MALASELRKSPRCHIQMSLIMQTRCTICADNCESYHTSTSFATHGLLPSGTMPLPEPMLTKSSSMLWSCVIHLRAISQAMFKVSVVDMSSKINYSRLHILFSEASELNQQVINYAPVAFAPHHTMHPDHPITPLCAGDWAVSLRSVPFKISHGYLLGIKQEMSTEITHKKDYFPSQFHQKQCSEHHFKLIMEENHYFITAKHYNLNDHLSWSRYVLAHMRYTIYHL